MRTFESAAPVLSAWMARKELTAAELSRRTGIDAGILRKIMTGRARAVSTRNLMALARFFGCSMQELIDAFSGCDVTRSVSKMTEIERRGGKRWDKPKKAGKSRDCRGGKF